jgi:hypothetical protein
MPADPRQEEVAALHATYADVVDQKGLTQGDIRAIVVGAILDALTTWKTLEPTTYTAGAAFAIQTKQRAETPEGRNVLNVAGLIHAAEWFTHAKPIQADVGARP